MSSTNHTNWVKGPVSDFKLHIELTKVAEKREYWTFLNLGQPDKQAAGCMIFFKVKTRKLAFSAFNSDSYMLWNVAEENNVL